MLLALYRTNFSVKIYYLRFFFNIIDRCMMNSGLLHQPHINQKKNINHLLYSDPKLEGSDAVQRRVETSRNCSEGTWRDVKLRGSEIEIQNWTWISEGGKRYYHKTRETIISKLHQYQRPSYKIFPDRTGQWTIYTNWTKANASQKTTTVLRNITFK